MESISIKSANTLLVIGEIEHLLVADDSIDNKGNIDLDNLGSIGISGLNCYYALKKINEFPYARVKELPKFSN